MAVLPEVVFTSSNKSHPDSEKVTRVVGGRETDSYTCSGKFRIFLFLFFLNTKHASIVTAAIKVKNARVDTSTTVSTVMMLLFSADFGRSTQKNMTN